MKKRELNEFFMKIALETSYLSKAIRKKVGVIAVKNKNIIGFAWNGTPTNYYTNSCENLEYKIKKHPNLSNISCSTFGEIFYKDILLKYKLSKKGYPRVQIPNLQNSFPIAIHLLMKETFFNNPDEKFYTQVNHIDGNKLNNKLNNLELCSNRYNSFQREILLNKKTSKYMGVSWSKSRKKWVGDVLVNEKRYSKRFDNEIEAFNFIKSKIDPRDLYGLKNHDYLITNEIVLHAEQNLLCKLASGKESLNNSELYCTLSPCITCAKMLYQTGIKSFYYFEKYRDTSGLDLLEEFGIYTEQIFLPIGDRLV